MLYLLILNVAIILLLTGVILHDRRKIRRLRRELRAGGAPQNPSPQTDGHFSDPMLEVQAELQRKEQDLMMHALVLTELKQTNQNIAEKLYPFAYRFSRKKDQEDFQQILNEIVHDATRDPMQDFEIMFRQMHREFNEKLLSVCPLLSRTELQICSLLRMNLSSKDMARLTCLNVASINITRHKIRKKLGLDPKISLTGYLIRF